MPTNTFINLSKDKRLRILRAAKSEFSRVPLEKAVIANIVKNAKIPRGSFYQYFDDIEDLYKYLLDYLYGFDKYRFVKTLEKTDNDVYEALKLNFANKVSSLEKEKNRQFRLNVMQTMMNFQKSETKAIALKYSSEDYLEEDVLPFEMVKKGTANKLRDLVMIIGKNCISNYLLKMIGKEETINDYNQYIDFLKIEFTK
ncbi:MAG: TetR/AcrR family transcriptional regulator [Bacilli bacterium]|jgi:AcrR family transcriptional regulator|nr:TetR/AcrR family transcriptional regulator [Bacilli bacterium]MDD2681595.1 TetR/AcrR family transcriptional regulator [Bacilli bacterium]MDD3121519.1 TetR/AcrR family transcriptional regulator [Bacilli bacterium]MDD4062790.1 TetR/AcrR family transcriptional regulator [Bacilli bacterium]MDD4482255.1 TetR/AcrR family transcriptional regulator [Bacilli bacterium]